MLATPILRELILRDMVATQHDTTSRHAGTMTSATMQTETNEKDKLNTIEIEN